MTVVAITPIEYGVGNGEVDHYGVGDELGALDDDTLRGLVQNGSAVETGKNRKFSDAPGAGGPVDEDTQKRDALIAKSQTDLEDDEPALNPGTPPTPGGQSAQNPQAKPNTAPTPTKVK